MTVYYIGPESRVYHARPNCPSLTGSQRYWHLHHATGTSAERVKAGRRPCRRCASAVVGAEDTGPEGDAPEDDWKGVYPGMCINPETCRGYTHCPRDYSCCE